MKNDTNSWDETLRQRLLEAEQDSDYPTWNEQRVWQKTQQQLTDNQDIASKKQNKRRTLFWYAAAAILLLVLPSPQRGNTKIAVEISPQSITQKENPKATIETFTLKAQKKNIKHFLVKKENKNNFFLETTTYSFVKKDRIEEEFEGISQKSKIDNLNDTDIPNIPSLGVRGITLDTTLHLQLPKKGNCTVLNLPLLREEKLLARLFRQFKRFNTEGTLPTNVSNIPVLVQRINGK